jgi:GDP-L-fucose synthase
MEQTAKIYIAGHRGMFGSGLERKLRKEGYNNIVTKTSRELDLRNQQAVNYFFEIEKPAYVILAAAKVGGIHAKNTYRAEFIYDNLMIEANIIHAAYLNKVTKLFFLGSSCIYSKVAPQPLKEEYLLSGYLEPTNQPYAIAKLQGLSFVIPIEHSMVVILYLQCLQIYMAQMTTITKKIHTYSLH